MNALMMHGNWQEFRRFVCVRAVRDFLSTHPRAVAGRSEERERMERGGKGKSEKKWKKGEIIILLECSFSPSLPLSF